LMNFGGHKYAAGMTMPLENLDIFKQRFEKIVSERITEDDLTPKMKVSANLDFSYLKHDRFWKILKQFAPFGPQNMRPVFRTSNIVAVDGSKLLKEKHLKLKIKQKLENEEKSPIRDAIAFNMGEYYPHIQNGQPFELCYTIEANNWKGRSTLQLMVKDLKLYE